jgi:branched-chain amino acid transport system substrate-binding protein
MQKLIRKIMVSLVSVCALSTASAADLVIGQVASMSGSNGADLGQGLQQGLKLAFSQANDAGGVYGKKIRLVVKDDKYVPDETVKLTRELIEQDKPIALAGYRGTANTIALIKSELLTKSNVPLVGTLTGAKEIQGAPNMYHVRTSYRDEVSQIVNQLGRMSLTKIGLFYVDDAFGQTGKEAFEQAMTAANNKAATIAAYDKTPDKMIPTIEKAVATLAASNPQAVVIVAVGDPVYEFIKRFRKLSPSTRLVSLSVVNPAVVVEKVGVETAHGIGFSQVFPYPYTESKNLIRDYRSMLRKYEKNAAPNYFSLEGYVYGRVLVEALKRAGPNPNSERLMASLNKMTELDLGGFFVKFDPASRNGSKYSELTVLGRDGRLMR